MINIVALTGRLTKAVDLRYTQSGKACAFFTLAVNRAYTNQNGEREADYINCVIWGKPAEALANNTTKGALIGVDGSIQTRSYDNQQGQRVYVTEVLAKSFHFLESKKTGHTDVLSNGNVNRPNNVQNQNTPVNFSNNDPFTANGEIYGVSEDDLPF